MKASRRLSTTLMQSICDCQCVVVEREHKRSQKAGALTFKNGLDTFIANLNAFPFGFHVWYGENTTHAKILCN